MRSHDLNRLLDKPACEASTLLEIAFSIPPHANDFWVGQAGGADDSGRHCNARAPGWETRGQVSHFPFHFSFSFSYFFTTRLTVELDYCKVGDLTPARDYNPAHG